MTVFRDVTGIICVKYSLMYLIYFHRKLSIVNYGYSIPITTRGSGDHLKCGYQ